jgi:hypothetical protein
MDIGIGMTNTDKLLDYLRQIDKPICDDCLSRNTKIEPRQTINQITRSLANTLPGFAKQKEYCPYCGAGNKLVSTLDETLGLAEHISLRAIRKEKDTMTYVNNNQRDGAISNSHVGSDLERMALDYFGEIEALSLQRNYSVKIGLSSKKLHRFDLGNTKVLVECKAHTWTNGNNVPSAKMSVWNEAMYYFLVASVDYEKRFFVQKDFSTKRNLTLLQYYLKTYYHLIPNDIIFYDFDLDTKQCDIYNHEYIERLSRN